MSNQPTSMEYVSDSSASNTSTHSYSPPTPKRKTIFTEDTPAYDLDSTRIFSLRESLEAGFENMLRNIDGPQPTRSDQLNLGIFHPESIPLDPSEFGLIGCNKKVSASRSEVKKAIQQAQIACQKILQKEVEYHRSIEYRNRYEKGVEQRNVFKQQDIEQGYLQKSIRQADRKRKRIDKANSDDDRATRLCTATTPVHITTLMVEANIAATV
jgi:hypothetical protein